MFLLIPCEFKYILHKVSIQISTKFIRLFICMLFPVQLICHSEWSKKLSQTVRLIKSHQIIVKMWINATRKLSWTASIKIWSARVFQKGDIYCNFQKQPRACVIFESSVFWMGASFGFSHHPLWISDGQK